MSTEFDELYFPSADARLTLYARNYPGDGPPLLLLHGLTRNSADFGPLAQHLAGRYRMIVPDQRGRGQSGYDDAPSNYRPDVYAGDMFALLDSLNLDKVTIIGTSLGGLIAMLMAAMQPQRIKAIILNDVGAVINPVGLARIQGYVGSASSFNTWADAAKACALINGQAFPDYGSQHWVDFAKRTCQQTADGEITVAYDPAIASAISDPQENIPIPPMWPLWEQIDALPVLLIKGELSDLLATETASEMAEGHSGPFAFIEVPNRGHAPMLDEIEAVTAIKEFLACHALEDD
jgi:pimeloyl-ACP methyl ester carboxylesterase